MILLSVNVNKIATLRNARGGQQPCVCQVAKDVLRFGANGITVHPRPDGRHILYQDVFDLKEMITAFNTSNLNTSNFNISNKGYREYNIEGYPSKEFLQLVEEIRPDQVTLVPDPPDVLTSNAGWKVSEHWPFLQQVCSRLQTQKMRVSLFVDSKDVNDQFLKDLKATGTNRVELYTEMFATAFATQEQEPITNIYVQAAHRITEVGLKINAGHDLSLDNVSYLRQQIPSLKEVSIGHALICEALYLGLEPTIKKYLQLLQGRENGLAN